MVNLPVQSDQFFDEEPEQDVETPFSPSVMDGPFSPRALAGHRFRITDDQDGNNSNTDDSDPDAQDYYNPNTYLEADSAGALFLQLLIEENRRRIKEIATKKPFHLAGPDKDLLTKTMKAINEDAVEGANPDKFVGIANILFQHKQYDEARALLTFENSEPPNLPKWPDNLGAALILAKIAEMNKKYEEVVSLLSKDGRTRFPGHTDALRVLAHGLNRAGQFEQTIAIIEEEESSENDPFKNQTVLQNYISALNHTDSSHVAVGKFTTHEALNLPCQPDPSFLTTLGIALNNCREYRKTYYYMRRFLKIPAFWNHEGFLSVITTASNELRLYGTTIELLTEQNGEYRFPKNINCLRNLGYAYVFTGRLSQARQLVHFAQNQGFDPSLIDGVISSLQNAEKTPQERQLANIHQRFAPKRGQSAVLFPEE